LKGSSSLIGAIIASRYPARSVETSTSNRSRLIFVAGIAAAGLLALAIVLLSGGGDSSGQAGAGLPDGCRQVDAPAAKTVQLPPPTLKAPAAGTTATVSTSCGDFVIALATADAPKTSASFVNLADHGVYDGTAFTRVVPGFVIQGGDPTGTGAGGPGYSVDEPPRPDTVYSRGVVAMAKSGADPRGRSGSQFFVVTAPDKATLPPDYALLGKVSEGLDIVLRIESVGTDSAAGDGPLKAPVVIEKVTINPGRA
jgi:cyclophilin family peptidyl-prolyl cis-trans isomerase